MIDENGNLPAMTEREIHLETLRQYDEAGEAEAERERQTAAHLLTMSMLDFSQMFEDANRINQMKETKGDYTPHLVQLRVALSLKIAGKYSETNVEGMVRDSLISEALVSICDIIGVD